MKVLLLGNNSELTGLGQQLANEHQVKAFFMENVGQDVYIPGIDFTDSWRSEVRWADLVVLGAPKWTQPQSMLREHGRLLFGVGGMELSVLEMPIVQPPEYGETEDLTLFGIWNGRKFLEPMFIGFSYDRLLTGDLGPKLACMGSLLLPLKDVEPFEEYISFLSQRLRNTDYRGPISWSFTAFEEKLVPISTTIGMEVAWFAPFVEMLDEDLFDFLLDTAAGTKKELKVKEAIALSCRLYDSPWPYKAEKENNWNANIVPGALKHIWLSDVSSNENAFYNIGPSGNFGFATSVGVPNGRNRDFIREPKRRLERVIGGIDHPTLQYRNDIGFDAVEKIKQLKAWGYL